MSICLHGDHRLVLVLRRQDNFVFTHLLDSVREANDWYLATDTEPATRGPFIPEWEFNYNRRGAYQPKLHVRLPVLVPETSFILKVRNVAQMVPVLKATLGKVGPLYNKGKGRVQRGAVSDCDIWQSPTVEVTFRKSVGDKKNVSGKWIFGNGAASTENVG